MTVEVACLRGSGLWYSSACCYIAAWLSKYMWIVLTLPTSQFAYSHFAYKCVSFRLHMGMTWKGFQGMTDFDLLWLTTLGDLVGTREFRGQDWLQGTRLTRGGPALNLNRFKYWRCAVNWKCEGSVRTEDGVLLTGNVVHTHPPPSQEQAQVDGVV